MKKTKKIKRRAREGKKGRVVKGMARGREKKKEGNRKGKKKVSIHFCYFSLNSWSSQHLTRNLSINDTHSYF